MKKSFFVMISLLLIMATPLVSAWWSHPCDYTYEQWADWCVDQQEVDVTYQECLAHWEQECSQPPANVPEFTIVTGLIVLGIAGAYLFTKHNS